MNKNSRVFITGYRGMVGSNLVNALKKKGFDNLLLKTRAELNLLDQKAVADFFKTHQPEYVFHAAAKVGGIHANQAYPADFLYENTTTAANVLHSAAENGVKKLLFMSSGCAYPRKVTQPMKEESILSGELEPTCDGMSLSKIWGLKLTELYQRQYKKSFISVIPANLYGPGDNFDPDHSHVVPGLMTKFHQAKVKNEKSVSVWGTGKAQRDFLYIDDLVDALLMLMDNYNEPSPINVSAGVGCPVGELAQAIKEVVGFNGEIVFDTTKPDGIPMKVLDNQKIQKLNWKPTTQLKDGLHKMYSWAIENNSFSKHDQKGA
jgi:GDP-L-fucose synthase